MARRGDDWSRYRDANPFMSIFRPRPGRVGEFDVPRTDCGWLTPERKNEPKNKSFSMNTQKSKSDE